MIQYVCDTCGAMIQAFPPPTWTTVNLNMQIPATPPAAPMVMSSALYVCDKHDPTDIPTALSNALRDLPGAANGGT
jgi:hypothetical protein